MNASEQITEHIKAVSGWRGEVLTRVRKVIVGAAPGLIEEMKWSTPVWSSNGNVVAAGAFKDHVKVNFFKGASLPDPKGLFNAGLDAKSSRAIDIREGDDVDERALAALVRAAVAANTGGTAKKPISKAKAARKT